MAKPAWGKKRICLACNTKYYDFNKSPIICPSCGTEFDPDTNIIKSRGYSSVGRALHWQCRGQRFEPA